MVLNMSYEYLLLINRVNRLPSKPPTSRHSLMETVSNPHPTAAYAFSDAFPTLWLRTIAVDPTLGALVAAYVARIVSLNILKAYLPTFPLRLVLPLLPRHFGVLD